MNFNPDFNILCHIHNMIWITESMYSYDLVATVKSIRLNDFEWVILRAIFINDPTLIFNFANESTKWMIIITHLEVEVNSDCIPEISNSISLKLPLSQGPLTMSSRNSNSYKKEEPEMETKEKPR